MPPNKGLIWSHFNQSLDTSGKVTAVTCKFCGAKYSFPNATRMREHLDKCEECPLTIKQSNRKKASGGGDEAAPKEQEEMEDDIIPAEDHGSVDLTSPPPAKKQKQLKMHQFSDLMSQQEKKEVDALFARAAYAKGAPLSIYEGKAMQSAFERLRPSYRPPEHHKMGTSLLNAEYALAQHSITEEVKAANCVVLMSDGWMNGRSEGLINFIFALPHPVFVKTMEQGPNKEDSDFLSQKIIEVIDKYGEGKVLAIVTDNAPVMRAAWKKVQINFPDIYAIGCGCHGLDLMIKHFICNGSLKRLYRTARSVVNTIKKKKVLKAHFCMSQQEKYGENASVSLKLPSKTRFFGALICLESLIVNKAALQSTVILENIDVPNNIRSTVLDNDDFWEKVKFVVCLLKSIADGIRLVECNDAKLSHLVVILMNITVTVENCLNDDDNPLGLLESNRIQGIVSKYTKFILKDIHLATYLIDPNFCGKGLNDENKLRATEVIRKIAKYLELDEDSVLENLIHYETRSNFYGSETLWKPILTMDALKWWNAFCSQQPLYPVAVRLLTIVPSATSCERTWSDYDHIHCKKRNRLLNSRIEKLVAVKQYLNAQELKSNFIKGSESLKKRIETLKSYPTINTNIESGDIFNFEENLHGSDSNDITDSSDYEDESTENEDSDSD